MADVDLAENERAFQRQFEALRQEVAAMPERVILDEIDSLRASVDLLRGNQRELMRFLDFCETDPANHDLWHQTSKKKQQGLSQEGIRLLHNYAASSKSLVDHTRGVVRRLYTPDEFPDYQREVTNQFATVPVIQFVQCLREVLTHQRAVPITFTADVNMKSGTTTVRCGLSKTALLQSDRWNATATRFLEDAADFIRLRDVISDYSARVKAFYTWFDERNYALRRVEIDRLRSKDVELRILYLGHELDTWLAEPNEPLTDHNLLATILDISEIRAIEQHPQQSEVRTAATLQTLGRYFKVPHSLAAKIRRAHAMPEFYRGAPSSHTGDT